MNLGYTLFERLDQAQTEADLRQLLNSLEQRLTDLLTALLKERKEIFSNSAEPSEDIRQIIRENLQQHEQRLTEIQVKTLKAEFPPEFEVKVKLVSGRHANLSSLMFKVSWDDQGHAVLKPTYSYLPQSRHGVLLRSVQKHLEKLLNTRRGAVMTLPDSYGLQDFNDLAGLCSNPMAEIGKQVKENILNYEPRLTRVKVEYMVNEERPLDLHFKITAQLREEGSKVAFKTTSAETGYLKLDLMSSGFTG